MFGRSADQLRRLSARFGITSLCLAILTTAAIWLGYTVDKGNHGLACAVFPGLLMVPVTLVLLSLTVVAGTESYAKTGANNWWVIPAAVVLIATLAFLAASLMLGRSGGA